MSPRSISFRAPEDIAQILATAETLTGLNRTELILLCVRQHLPRLALEISATRTDQMQAAAAQLRALAAHTMPPVPPVPGPPTD